MAKKIASGATHVVFDVPVGPTMKIQHFRDAEIIAKKFAFLAKKFHITVVTDINETRQNAGRGVGPVLEAKDVLQVLERKKERSLALEAKALRLSGKLLDICLADRTKKSSQTGEELAKEILYSGKAHAKMREIIKVQGGDPDIESTKLRAGTHQKEVVARKSGRVTSIDNRQISIICRILGCPTDKRAGLYTNRRLEDQVDKNDILYTLYSSDKWRLEEAVETLKHVPIYAVS
jgi:thymidine phosphorylase